jgi:hypothetical protein
MDAEFVAGQKNRQRRNGYEIRTPAKANTALFWNALTQLNVNSDRQYKTLLF